jgi:hypothetical protein
MKKNAKFLGYLILCIYSYWYCNRWHVKHHLGLTFTFHTLFIYDENYNYYRFAFLPRLSTELRVYYALKHKGPLFDYLRINLSFLVFHFEWLLERKG